MVGVLITGGLAGARVQESKALEKVSVDPAMCLNIKVVSSRKGENHNQHELLKTGGLKRCEGGLSPNG